MTITINELREMKRWIAWGDPSLDTLKEGKVKKDKSPLPIGNSRKVSQWHIRTDLWGTYNDAREWQYNVDDKDFVCHGVGFVLNGSGITFFDFDDCIDHMGKIDSEVLRVCQHLNSYTELSPSKRGVHVYVVGEKPDWAKDQSVFTLKNGKKMEVYYANQVDASRYTTYTEYVLFVDENVDKGELEIADRTAEIDDILSVYRAPEFKPKPKQESSGVRVSSEISERRVAGFFEKVIQSAESAIANAGDGSYHNVRRARAKTVGGYYATCLDYGYKGMTTNEILDRLYYAKEPSSNKRMEYRTIEWGFNAGINSPLELPFNPLEKDEPPTPPPTSPKPPKSPKSDSTAAEDSDINEIVADDDLQAIFDEWDFKDIGYAKAYVSAHGNDRIYASATKSWHIWDGRVWYTNETTTTFVYNEILEFVHNCAKTYSGDKDVVSQSKNGRLINAVYDQVTKLPQIVHSANIFDTYDDYFPVKNGIIHLPTMELIPHKKDMYFTNYCDINFNPTATAPFHAKFLNQILMTQSSDSSIIEYWRDAVGYSLSGRCDAQKFFFCFGTGSNGKSVALRNIVSRLLGGFAVTVHHTALSANGGTDSSTNTEIASIIGKRVVLCTENSKGRRLNEPLIKLIADGSEFSSAEKFQAKRVTKSRAKIWMSGNHYPSLNDADDGLFRRLEVIPFDNTISDADKLPDSELDKMFNEEAEGILLFYLIGAKRMYQNKFRLTSASRIQDNMAMVKKDSDTIQLFIDEYCDTDTDRTQGMKITKSLLFNAYLAYCKDNNIKIELSKTNFNKVIKYQKKFQEGGNGRLWTIGLQLRPDKYVTNIELSKIYGEVFNSITLIKDATTQIGWMQKGADYIRITEYLAAEE